MASPEQLLAVRDIARWLGLHPKTIYAQVEAGAIPCVRLGPTGRTIRFRREDIERLLAANLVRASRIGQGLPERVEDPEAVARVASLVGRST